MAPGPFCPLWVRQISLPRARCIACIQQCKTMTFQSSAVTMNGCYACTLVNRPGMYREIVLKLLRLYLLLAQKSRVNSPCYRAFRFLKGTYRDCVAPRWE